MLPNQARLGIEGIPLKELWVPALFPHPAEPQAPIVRPEHGYRPHGNLRRLFELKVPQVVVSGPSETGKSLSCLELLDSLAWQYAGVQAAIIRKTYQSTVGSVLQTYEKLVLGSLSPVTKYGGGHPQWYDYPNGSRIWIGGMDNATRILSSERDVIFVNQAEELTLDEWETLSTRTTGRAGNMPYGQLIGDCNPSYPTHWIKQLANQGKIAFIESRHKDNPTLYNEAGTLTERGRASMQVLDNLTGARRLRLRDGQWAAAEGMVYEDAWDASIHLIDRFEIPADWSRYWAIDFGYVNPFVWQAWAQDGDGRLYRYRELYCTQKLVEDMARHIKTLTEGEPRPVQVICDHDEEGRATLERHLGLKTRQANKSVKEGIQSVTARLRKQDDDKPRLFFLRDSLAERDKSLDDRRLPACTEEEFESYVWNQSASSGQKNKGARYEEPIKANDHGMDAMRYLCHTLDSAQARRRFNYA